MKKVLFALTALAALALLAPNAVVAQGALNHIGVYSVENPDLADLQASARLNTTGGGSFALYVVVTNPWNIDDDTPIANLGGFEFKLLWPSGWFVTPALHASATNFMTSPNFFCGANVPVVNNMCMVVTLNCGSFNDDPDTIFMAPVDDNPSIPGALAITDADDNFSISQAYPSSGDFANPVFGYNMDVVPNDDVSFGNVKALFR